MSDLREGSAGAPDAGSAAAARQWMWPVLFLAALVVYGLTANRGPQWQDFGKHIYRVVTGELVNPLGLALAHPLHYWLGRLATSLDMFEPSLAVTLVSSLAAAVTVANLYGATLSWTGSVRAGLFAAISLGVAHTFWRLSTLAETYTVTTALFAAELWCLVLFVRERKARWACLMLLANGLGLSNHLLALLSAPVIAGVALIGTRRGWIKPTVLLIGAGLWLLGSLPYTGLVALEAGRTGEVWATLHSALFGQAYADKVLNIRIGGHALLVNLAFTALSFPNLLMAFAVAGLWRGGESLLTRRALLIILCIHGLFVLRYSVPDAYLFFLPAYVVLCLFGGAGFAVMERRSSRRVRGLLSVAAFGLLATTPLVYAAAPRLAREAAVLKGQARPRPYRDNYVYAFTPWSVVERSAANLAKEAVFLAGKDGLIVVEDGMAAWAVLYEVVREAEGGPEVMIGQLEKIDAEKVAAAVDSGATVVLVPWDASKPPEATPTGEWNKAGELWVMGRRDQEARDQGIEGSRDQE